MKKGFIVLAILLCSACSSTENVTEIRPMLESTSSQEAAGYLAATCAGFESGHDSQLSIFNDCMNQAAEIIAQENTKGANDE